MVPFLLLLNTGVAQVAYAADPVPATPKVGLDCKTGFTGEFTDMGDYLNCKKVAKGYNKETDKCAEGFSVNKNSSSEDPVNGELVCRKNVTANIGADTKAISNGIQILAGVQQGLNRLIWPVLVLIGGLMENDLIYGNGMEEKLRDVWIPIRNLVNILFVVVLVGLALYNVLGLSEDTTSIKSILPKIVIGIIAVNFSFVAIKVVLDGVNVMTTAVFALPDQVGGGLANMTNLPDDQQSRLCAALEGTPFSQFDAQTDETITKAKELATYRNVGQSTYFAGLFTENSLSVVLPADSIQQITQKITALDGAITAKGGITDNTNKEFQTKIDAAQNANLCTGNKLNENGKLFLNHYNSRNAAFAMALNMGKIVFYNDVDPKMASSAGDGYEKLFTNTLFSMVLYLIYVVSFIALFVVLLGRLVVMWLSIAVSPILLLMLASSQVKEKMGGFGKLADQFVKNAIAPLLISLSMTIGWIMLKAVQGLDIGSQLGAASGSFIGNSVFKINTNGVPVASLNTLQDFMVALGVIAVVWIGVFAAAEGTIAEGATKWIKEKVETAGKFVGQLPFKHLPLIPINLPDHPHDSYTFSQLGHYIETLTHGNDNKLTELATGKKDADETNLRDMHDESGLKNWVKNIQGRKNDLHDSKYKAPIADWLDKNKTLVSNMEGAGVESKRIVDNLRILATKDDEKARKDAAKIINGLPGVTGAEGKLPTTGKPTTPPVAPTKPGATPAAGTAPAAITKESEIGKKLGTDARIKTVNDSKVKIDGEIKKPAADAAAQATKDAVIKTQVSAIGKAFQESGKAPTVEELKTIFGANYDTVKNTFEGEAGLITALSKPPTPPAGGTPTPPAKP